MSTSILKNPNVIKVYIDFTTKDKKRIREQVYLQYEDGRFCYFLSDGEMKNIKLSWRNKAEITVCTPDGRFKTTTILKEATTSLSKMIYKVDVPKNWDLEQLRGVVRKQIKTPVVIKFTDDMEIKSEIYDLSLGGFAIFDETLLGNVHKSFPAVCTIYFPEDLSGEQVQSIPNLKIKFVRERKFGEIGDFYQKTQYCFKFISLSPQDIESLKEILSLTV